MKYAELAADVSTKATELQHHPQGRVIPLAENDIRVPHIHVIEILVIDRHCN